MRQKADLDRLKFKMNHTVQLLKEEQKQQEGKRYKCCHSRPSGGFLYFVLLSPNKEVMFLLWSVRLSVCLFVR